MKLIISILLFSQLSFGYSDSMSVNYTNSQSSVSNGELMISVGLIVVSGTLLWSMLKGMGKKAQWHLKEKQRLEKKIQRLKEIERQKKLKPRPVRYFHQA